MISSNERFKCVILFFKGTCLGISLFRKMQGVLLASPDKYHRSLLCCMKIVSEQRQQVLIRVVGHFLHIKYTCNPEKD